MLDIPLSFIGILFSPLTIIIVIVVTAVILANNDKKKKAAQAAAATAAVDSTKTTQAVAPPKPKNPMAKWNWLLYIGSFLIILAMIYFVDSVDDSAVAPTTIILTLIIYAAGLAIHKTVNYLKPVGKAFTYSALCMVPLWLISLDAIKLPAEIIPLIVSLTFMVMSFLAALVTESKVLGYIAMLSPIPFILSFHSLFFPIANTQAEEAEVYFACLAPMITALVPMALWLKKPKWLPIAFRHASMGIGIVLMPLTYVFTLILFLVPDLSNHVPLIRTLCAAFMLVYAIAHWYKTKKHGYFVTLRFALQALILAAVCDALNYSLIRIYYGASSINYTAALVCAIVWLLTFLAQVVYSLYARCKDAKEEKLEHIVGILSIVGIFTTPILCADFERIPLAIIWLVICLIAAILGVLHSVRYKNVLWSIATVASILIAPAIFGINIATPAWAESQYLACYSVIGLIFLAGYYMLRQIQKHESDTLGVISLSVTSLLILASSFGLELSGVGFLIVAIYFAAFAVISKVKEMYEIAIYAGALSIYSFCGNVFDGMIGKDRNTLYYDYERSSSTELLYISLTAVRAHILGAALLLTNWLYEREKQPNQQVRFIFGYAIFSLIMTFGCLSQEAIGWSIFFLIEQAACLLFAITNHRTWLVWFSSIEIFITALTLTGGFNYIWLGIIGVALIAVVVWQLKKNNDKLTRDAATPPQPIAPVAETTEEKAEDKPAEDKKADEKPEDDKPEEKSEDDTKGDEFKEEDKGKKDDEEKSKE